MAPAVIRVENAVDRNRSVGIAGVAVDPRRLTLGLPAAVIDALGLVGGWSEWRGVRVYGPATLHVCDRFQTLDVTEAAGDAVRVGPLLLDHLRLSHDRATGRLVLAGEWVLDL